MLASIVLAACGPTPPVHASGGMLRGVKFVILAALNLVECIAEAAKLRAGS